MKIKTATNNRKKIIIITIFLLLVVVATIVYFLNRNQNQIITEQNDKTSSVKEDQIDKTKSSTDSTKSDGTDLPSKNPSQSSDDHSISDQKSNIATPSNPPEKPLLSRASQKNSSIKVVATLQLSSPGYCELKLSKSGQSTVSREANIVVGPSYYSCDFVVPIDSLSAKGAWNAIVIHHVGKSATASEQTVVEVE